MKRHFATTGAELACIQHGCTYRDNIVAMRSLIIRLVLAAMCLLLCSCRKRELSSVCIANVSSDVDSITLMALLNPKLPDGAILSGDFSSPALFVTYHDVRHEVIRRKQAGGACFDFKPAIALYAEDSRSREHEAGLGSQVARVLSDYRMYFLAIIAVLIALGIIHQRAMKSGSALPGASDEANGTIDMTEGIQLVTALPELAQELEQLLREVGEQGLAEQVPSLRILDRCRCGDDFCSTFYVQPQPEGSYGPNHRNVALDPERGMLILDVVSEKIMAVEVLYREDVRKRILSLVP